MKHTTTTQRRRRATAPPPPSKIRDNTPVFQRRAEPRGKLVVFGYDYFADHAQAAGIPTPRLLSYEVPWGWGEEYAYEALQALEKIGILQRH